VLLAVGEYVLPGSEAEQFAAARALGADGVELRFGATTGEGTPLLQPGRPAALRSQARAAGVTLASVFAGYLLTQSLHTPDEEAGRQHAEVLRAAVTAAAEAGARVVVLPLFGAVEPRDELAVRALIETLRPCADQAAAVGVVLGLETTLPVTALLALVRRLNHPAMRIAYDVGAAAALGWDSVADLKLLGDTVCQLRVRDGTADGRPMPLGQGVVGKQWSALWSAWQTRDAVERWCVLEVPAQMDAPEWARAGIAFLRSAGKATD
jgi:sugar phosphate isomerase/epimerase